MNYPDLSKAKIISFDTETYDPNLIEMGPGVFRDDGSKLLGVSISNGEGFSEYYNIGHYDCGKQEREQNIEYLRDVFASNIPKLGQSIMYDLDWLENGPDHIKVNGRLASIDIAEALLDETQEEYNLDFLGFKYLKRGKETTEIDRFCIENGLEGDSRKWLWKMPYELVRRYAKEDVNLPIEIFRLQLKKLEEQNLMDLFAMESELIRVLLLMRKTGVLIDQDRRDRNGLEIQNIIESSRIKLYEQYGEFNYNSSKQIATLLDSQGIAYPKTAKGNPQIDKAFFTRFAETVPLIHDIEQIRKAARINNNFIMGSHVKYVTGDGLIHCQFHNLRNDNFGALVGTRSGRFSSTHPNLQQQPSKDRDEFYGTKCREDFIPFPEHLWGKIDYSQIEYRFMAHFAVGEGAEELRKAYNEDPTTDYHKFVMLLTSLTRPLSKNLNYGVAFGMGIRHMAEFFGWSIEYAYEIMNIYHARAPYVKATMHLVEQTGRRRGYIRTFLNRREHLVDPDKAYTMYCRLVQGSAADLMKKAMIEIYHAGLFDIMPPHLTVHDELDMSVPKTRIGIEAFEETKHIMETCIKLKVPIQADAEIGTSWAKLEDANFDGLKREYTA